MVLDQITLKHSSGVSLVSGSKNVLDDNEMVTPELLEWMLDSLKTRFRYVIVDLPTHVLDPYHQFLVERADEVVVITTPDIPGLFRTRQYLDLAQKYLDMNKIKTVINRHNLKAASGMTNQQVEEQFPYPIFDRLPNDWDLNVEANSQAKLFSQVNANAELSKAVQNLAAKLMGDIAAQEQASGKGGKPAGLLGKLFAGSKTNKVAT